MAERYERPACSDLQLIDELLVDLKGSGRTWETLERESYAARQALARLGHAWHNDEVARITLSLADYFERENDRAEEKAEAPEGDAETPGT